MPVQNCPTWLAVLQITAVNEKLQDEPATVNGSPEDEGWLVKAKWIEMARLVAVGAWKQLLNTLMS